VENGALVPQPDDMNGIFYTGDCYIILYSYLKGKRGSEQFILYFWQVCRPQSQDGFWLNHFTITDENAQQILMLGFHQLRFYPLLSAKSLF
jgi:hypothetical protein